MRRFIWFSLVESLRESLLGKKKWDTWFAIYILFASVLLEDGRLKWSIIGISFLISAIKHPKTEQKMLYIMPLEKKSIRKYILVYSYFVLGLVVVIQAVCFFAIHLRYPNMSILRLTQAFIVSVGNAALLSTWSTLPEGSSNEKDEGWALTGVCYLIEIVGMAILIFLPFFTEKYWMESAIGAIALIIMNECQRVQRVKQFYITDYDEDNASFTTRLLNDEKEQHKQERRDAS
ncbi:hypothetical protein lbkm_4242 [Lachnospiraceae bacterium KM106-2]|nr:hypothetical protein lbkm_4242 [Lachnospiraceae bacterium KM106-2]